jgi:preprotein translocase subunit SecD
MRLVDAGPFPDAASAEEHYRPSIPTHIELLSDNEGSVYAMDRTLSVSGRLLRDAYSSRDENGRPAVGFSFNPEGGRRFGQLTEQNVGRSLAVVLDHRVQSVARIETRISDSGIIRGGGAGFAAKEVDDLVVVLKSGELLAPVKYASEEQIGASLGADSIRKGITAAVAALVLVVAFMLFYYRWAGVNAVIAMCLNIVILLGAMAYFRAPLTLPGIAGVILTIGVGIDSNVLIFERIREEIRAGKPPVSAVAIGFKRVFITLVDTHLAALISAAFLFLFGTGAIRGFAVTLAIGLASNMFTSVFVSKTLFDWTLWRMRGTSGFSI